jgi:hypothetical protein
MLKIVLMKCFLDTAGQVEEWFLELAPARPSPAAMLIGWAPKPFYRFVNFLSVMRPALLCLSYGQPRNLGLRSSKVGIVIWGSIINDSSIVLSFEGLFIASHTAFEMKDLDRHDDSLL